MSMNAMTSRLAIEDLHLVEDLMLASDLAEMPCPLSSAPLMAATHGSQVLAPLLTAFARQEIEVLVNRAEDGAAAALIFTKGFPHDTFWWIGALVVRPAERRHGHGSSLISALK